MSEENMELAEKRNAKREKLIQDLIAERIIAIKPDRYCLPASNIFVVLHRTINDPRSDYVVHYMDELGNFFNGIYCQEIADAMKVFDIR